MQSSKSYQNTIIILDEQARQKSVIDFIDSIRAALQKILLKETNRAGELKYLEY
jgi:hypothetical protein